jgi:hypothetical protein
MSLHTITDIIAGAGLFLFTSTDIVTSNGFEIAPINAIMQVGVVAVLWFWLRDNKLLFQKQTDKCEEQYEDLKKTFEKEVDEQRRHYNEWIEILKTEHVQDSQTLAKVLEEQKEEIKIIQNKLFDTISNDKRV